MDDAYMDHAPKDIDCTTLIEQCDNEAAEQLLQVARSDGHFSGEDVVKWPGGSKLTVEALMQRAQLIATIHEGIPTRRERRRKPMPTPFMSKRDRPIMRQTGYT